MLHKVKGRSTMYVPILNTSSVRVALSAFRLQQKSFWTTYAPLSYRVSVSSSSYMQVGMHSFGTSVTRAGECRLDFHGGCVRPTTEAARLIQRQSWTQCHTVPFAVQSNETHALAILEKTSFLQALLYLLSQTPIETPSHFVAQGTKFSLHLCLASRHTNRDVLSRPISYRMRRLENIGICTCMASRSKWLVKHVE
jgi:hypothetical protein